FDGSVLITYLILFLSLLVLSVYFSLYFFRIYLFFFFSFFFFNDPAPTEIYTLFLHDALPISCWGALTRNCREVRLSARRETSQLDRKSTRLNSSHVAISYAVFCLKKKN